MAILNALFFVAAYRFPKYLKTQMKLIIQPLCKTKLIPKMQNRGYLTFGKILDLFQLECLTFFFKQWGKIQTFMSLLYDWHFASKLLKSFVDIFTT